MNLADNEQYERNIEDLQKTEQINKIFENTLKEAMRKPRITGFRNRHKRWLPFGGVSASPDKWDILAALFMAVGVAAATFGIAWACSYLVASLSGSQIAAAALTAVTGDPIAIAKKMETFIMKNMPWLIMKDPLLTVKDLHRKTKKFLMKHFGTMDEFEAFVNAE